MLVSRNLLGLYSVLSSSLLGLILRHVTNIINQTVEKPYMDETFHIPQAQQYCQGIFNQYNPKLTTPPGLYLISYTIIWLRDKILLSRDNLVCDTIDLRKTNHIMAILSFMTLILIQIVTTFKVRKNSLPKHGLLSSIDHLTNIGLTNIMLNSLAIITLPPLFFFYSLYYTDIGSLLFILLAYLFYLIDKHILAAICGMVSVTFRQTNIVWVFYIACLTIMRTLDEHNSKRIEISHDDSKIFDKTSKIDRNHVRRDRISSNSIGMDVATLKTLIMRSLPYALVGACFVLFVFINKGIVLGDKEAHQPRLHFAQILYFLGFCSVFGASWIFQVRVMKRFLYFTLRSPLTAIIAITLITYLIASGRYAHPYLLADNRHITFYIWRRILDRHNSYVPYLLTPIYLMASFSVWHHFRSQGCKRLLLFIFCSLLVIVPNGLFELRYFIVPYVFLRLNAEVGVSYAITEIIKNILINTGMHYLFLNKTFRWSDSQELQRIMW